jgi:hypothetical protein
MVWSIPQMRSINTIVSSFLEWGMLAQQWTNYRNRIGALYQKAKKACIGDLCWYAITDGFFRRSAEMLKLFL